jgi:hypothetical protein
MKRSRFSSERLDGGSARDEGFSVMIGPRGYVSLLSHLIRAGGCGGCAIKGLYRLRRLRSDIISLVHVMSGGPLIVVVPGLHKRSALPGGLDGRGRVSHLQLLLLGSHVLNRELNLGIRRAIILSCVTLVLRNEILENAYVIPSRSRGRNASACRVGGSLPGGGLCAQDGMHVVHHDMLALSAGATVVV